MNKFEGPVFVAIQLDEDKTTLFLQNDKPPYFLVIPTVMPILFIIFRKLLIHERNFYRLNKNRSAQPERRANLRSNPSVQPPISDETNTNYISYSTANCSTFSETRNYINTTTTTNWGTTRVGDTNLCIPEYIKAIINVDFLIDKELCAGGFGNIYLGFILNERIVTERNNCHQSCIIKVPLEVNVEMFYQELSEVSQKVFSLVSNCSEYDSRARATMTEVHDKLTTINWNKNNVNNNATH